MTIRQASRPTNPIASIFAWTQGLNIRGQFDEPPVVAFADLLEKVCVATVESGFMTKDLALLVGSGQKYLTTAEFMDKLAVNLVAKLAAKAA